MLAHGARITAAATLVVATLGARPEPPAPAERVLAAYYAALAKLHHPRFSSYEYTVEQLGFRNMEQSHRVYRSEINERDETFVVDGHPSRSVRIFAKRVNRYDIARFAPRPGAYALSFEGAVNESDAYGYVFSTQARTGGAFAVTEFELDGHTYLPRTVHFKIAGSGARGAGTLTYGAVDRYWLILSAEVTARLADGTTAHEAIRWSDYRFPASLPDSTFVVPHEMLPAVPYPTPAPPAEPALPTLTFPENTQP